MSELKENLKRASNLKLGVMISSGNGYIYTLSNYPNRLVKFINTSYLVGALPEAEKVIALLSYLKDKNNPSIAKIYKVGSFKLKTNNYIYYIMQKLRDAPTSYSASVCLRGYLHGAAMPKKVLPEVKKFMQSVKKLKYRYRDCHAGNIMQDSKGTLKLIDLESFLWQY